MEGRHLLGAIRIAIVVFCGFAKGRFSPMQKIVDNYQPSCLHSVSFCGRHLTREGASASGRSMMSAPCLRAGNGLTARATTSTARELCRRTSGSTAPTSTPMGDGTKAHSFLCAGVSSLSERRAAGAFAPAACTRISLKGVHLCLSAMRNPIFELFHAVDSSI